jgi:hypothetical protein
LLETTPTDDALVQAIAEELQAATMRRRAQQILDELCITTLPKLTTSELALASLTLAPCTRALRAIAAGAESDGLALLEALARDAAAPTSTNPKE